MKTNSKTCEGCNGACCRYVAIEIDAPETLKDFENIKWYVCHKNVNVYVDEDDEWHVEFITHCEFLGEDSKCKVYDKRPKICRDFHQDECPFHNEYEEKHTFKSLEDLERFIDGWKKKN